MPSPMRACTPGIRMFTVPRVSSKTPLDDCDAAWQTATPASVGQFSAVGYFFGRMLYKALGIPVGLITSNWGGSTIEAWMTVDAIDATPGIDHAVAKSGTYDNSIPQRLYNGMILPVCRYTAKGFIWYQGESQPQELVRLQGVAGLARQTLAGNLGRREDAVLLYAAGALPLRGRHTAFAAAGDRGAVPGAGRNPATRGSLPRPTWATRPASIRRASAKLGERLAFLALANDYGVTGLPAPAPVYKSMERDGK